MCFIPLPLALPSFGDIAIPSVYVYVPFKLSSVIQPSSTKFKSSCNQTLGQNSTGLLLRAYEVKSWIPMSKVISSEVKLGGKCKREKVSPSTTKLDW